MATRNAIAAALTSMDSALNSAKIRADTFWQVALHENADVTDAGSIAVLPELQSVVTIATNCANLAAQPIDGTYPGQFGGVYDTALAGQYAATAARYQQMIELTKGRIAQFDANAAIRKNTSTTTTPPTPDANTPSVPASSYLPPFLRRSGALTPGGVLKTSAGGTSAIPDDTSAIPDDKGTGGSLVVTPEVCAAAGGQYMADGSCSFSAVVASATSGFLGLSSTTLAIGAGVLAIGAWFMFRRKSGPTSGLAGHRRHHKHSRK